MLAPLGVTGAIDDEERLCAGGGTHLDVVSYHVMMRHDVIGYHITSHDMT